MYCLANKSWTLSDLTRYTYASLVEENSLYSAPSRYITLAATWNRKAQKCYSVNRTSIFVYVRSGDEIRVEGEIFSIFSDRPCGPHSLLYNGYRVFPGGKAARAWRWPPTPNSRRGSGPSWPVLGWAVALPLYVCEFICTCVMSCCIEYMPFWVFMKDYTNGVKL